MTLFLIFLVHWLIISSLFVHSVRLSLLEGKVGHLLLETVEHLGAVILGLDLGS